MGTYILASLLFVFAAMAEFALVIFIKQNSDWRKDGRIGMELEKEIEITEKPSINVVAPVDGLGSSMKDTEYVVPKARHSSMTTLELICNLPITSKIDYSAFIVFNFIYLILNCIYWILYLQL